MSAGTAGSSDSGSAAARFLDDPLAYFNSSLTAIQSVSREELMALQLDALRMRFEQHRERIPMVGKLADRLGIDALADLDSAVPLLFEHTMYKSYPTALLERQRFDQLTRWLGKLTSVDLTGVDVSSCDSIDSWLDALAEQARLDTTHTSGTSGTMSFFPWSERDLELKFRTRRITELQRFGAAPAPDDLTAPVHFIGTSDRHRLRPYLAEAISMGSPDHVHLRRPSRPSADLLWLASRLRLAAARGDLSRVAVPPQLLARREELQRVQAPDVQRDQQWLEEIKSLQGERVLWSIFAHDLFEIARPRVAQGERWSFGPRSALTMAGGTKGNVLPDGWRDVVQRFVDIPATKAYGMTELAGFNMECEYGRYHLQPWFVLYVLDPDTSEPLPRHGTRRGRAAFFDLLPESHWGGVITGDEIEAEFDQPCRCGRTSIHLGPDIVRFSEKRGGDDKITCAATPEAHAEAMNFLVGL